MPETAADPSLPPKQLTDESSIVYALNSVGSKINTFTLSEQPLPSLVYII